VSHSSHPGAMPGLVIAPSGDGHRTQQELPVQGQTLFFSQEEIDLLESAVHTAYRQAYYEGADKEHLDALWNLRRDLDQYTSEAHSC
jgi:hypothetical protein